MRTPIALLGLAIASPAHADVIFEKTIPFFTGAIDTSIDEYGDAIVFEWLIVSPLGSPDPADRIPILSLDINNTTPPGTAASSASGPAFDAATAAFTDDTLTPGLFFIATRTNFLLPDGTINNSNDLLSPESLFFTDEFGNPVSLAGAQIDELRVELVSATITPNANGPSSVRADYQLSFQILGVIPSPATAAPIAIAALLAARRRR